MSMWAKNTNYLELDGNVHSHMEGLFENKYNNKSKRERETPILERWEIPSLVEGGTGKLR